MNSFHRARHERVKYLLRLNQSSLSDVAASLGISISTVSIVSQGRGKSQRVQASISQIIGIPIEKIWPEQYQKEEVINELNF